MKSSVVFKSASVANILYPLCFSLVTLLVLAVFVWLLVRNMHKKETETVASDEARAVSAVKRVDFTALLLVFLIIGLILRLIFVFAVKGYRPDNNVFIALFEYIKNNGFVSRYYTVNGTGVFPISYYIYAFMGVFYNAGLTSTSVMTPFLLKLPLVIADLITAFILYKLAEKYVNSYVAIVVAGFVCVFPVFIFASSVWATQYALLTMFLALSLYFVARKNHVALIGCYSAALLTHKDAVYLWPLFAVFVIYSFVKAVICIRAEKIGSFVAIWKNPDTRPAFTIPVSVFGFLIISYLISLPVLIHSFGAGFFTFIYRIYLAPLGSFTNFGHNALGIFNLFMRNGVDIGSKFPKVVFIVLFAAIVTGIVLLVYLSKKNRANLIYLAAYILLTLATYFVGFSEFSLLPVLTILLLAFLLIRDKRILMIFAILSVAIIVNASAVMASAGYYNNLSDYYVGMGDITNPEYTGSVIFKGGVVAVGIVCSVLAVLAHLYSTIVLLDISMSNKRKLLPTKDNANFGQAMAAFFRMKDKNAK